jgi:hypothetical protein
MDPIALLLLLPLLLGRRGGSRGPTRYEPGSAEQIALFEEAAEYLGVPRSWASSNSLITLLKKESGGWVGRPNYEYGHQSATRKNWDPEIYKTKNADQWPALWAHLRAGGEPPKGRGATGLGQLVLATAKEHYPDGLQGIGDPFNEAVGMLSYINARWKSPNRALECYEAYACMSGVGIDGYGAKTWTGY